MFHHLALTTVIAADRRRDFTRAADEHRRAHPAPFPMRLGRPSLVAPVAATTGDTIAAHPAATHPATQPATIQSNAARPAA